MVFCRYAGGGEKRIWEQVNEREKTRLLTHNYVHDLREFIRARECDVSGLE